MWRRAIRGVLASGLLATGCSGDTAGENGMNFDAVYGRMKEYKAHCRDDAKEKRKACLAQCKDNARWFNDGGNEECPRRCDEWYDQNVSNC